MVSKSGTLTVVKVPDFETLHARRRSSNSRPYRCPKVSKFETLAVL